MIFGGWYGTKCILVKEIGSFAWTRKKLTTPSDGEVLIRVEVTGLCRTDLNIIRHCHRDLVLPRIPGEEVVGRIIAKGAAVDSFDIGDRVYVYPGVWCGRCAACRQGAQNLQAPAKGLVPQRRRDLGKPTSPASSAATATWKSSPTWTRSPNPMASR